MENVRYPRLEIDLTKLETNVRNIYKHCHDHGVNLCCVTKGFTANPEMCKAVARGGYDQLGTSRLSHVRSMIANGLTGPFLLLRIPQMSELEELADLCQYSLQSEPEVIEELNRICVAKGKKHKVVLMFDLGDLREGFWDWAEGIRTALRVENDLEGLELAGIGTNLGCYGSVMPTVEKMNDLVGIAEEIEAAIGRKLEIVSGGATSSYGLVYAGVMPTGINHLRIGEELSTPLDVPVSEEETVVPDDVDQPLLLQAQIVELKLKASKPRGVMFRDAFRNTPVYPDYGDRTRAIVALGRHDIADFSYIEILEPGCKILGGSSDHTIIDVEDAERELHVGDIISFHVTYAGQMFVTCTPDINIVYKK